MKDIEKAILRYLESRPDNWKWVSFGEVLDKKSTIDRFKKDKNFRKFIVENAIILAIDMFSKEE